MKMLILVFTIFSSIAYGKDLKVLSLNAHCLDDWDNRLEDISKLVEEKHPDVLFFQELCVGKSGNAFQSLIDKFESKNLHYSYHLKQFTHDAWDGLYKEYIAVFSVYNFNQVDQGFLPQSPLQRAYLGVSIFGNWIVNTHLEHDPKYANYRKEQVEFLSRRFANSSAIIGGDFNSGPASYEQQTFFQFNFLPAFAGPTFPADKPEYTIDGFWLSKSFAQKMKSYQFTRFTDFDNLSDHLAVEFSCKM